MKFINIGRSYIRYHNIWNQSILKLSTSLLVFICFTENSCCNILVTVTAVVSSCLVTTCNITLKGDLQMLIAVDFFLEDLRSYTITPLFYAKIYIIHVYFNFYILQIYRFQWNRFMCSVCVGVIIPLLAQKSLNSFFFRRNHIILLMYKPRDFSWHKADKFTKKLCSNISPM